MKIPRSLGGVFCDDIRQEVHGKISLIGCYTGLMAVAEFPTTLPKLCAHVRLVTPAEQPFIDVRFMILRDDDVLLEAEMPRQAKHDYLSSESSASAINDIHAQFVLSPLTLTGPCTLRVRAVADGKELRGLALPVTQAEAGRPPLLEKPTPMTQVKASKPQRKNRAP